MNAKLALSSALLAATFAGAALAETPTIATEQFAGSRSRAEVQAELQAYKQSGVNPWSTQYSQVKNFKSTKTRDQVVAEYLASRQEVNAFTGEDSGSAYLAQVRPVGRTSSTLAGSNTNGL
jgi:peptidase E